MPEAIKIPSVLSLLKPPLTYHGSIVTKKVLRQIDHVPSGGFVQSGDQTAAKLEYQSNGPGFPLTCVDCVQNNAFHASMCA
jgi:hypothetical protein